MDTYTIGWILRDLEWSRMCTTRDGVEAARDAAAVHAWSFGHVSKELAYGIAANAPVDGAPFTIGQYTFTITKAPVSVERPRELVPAAPAPFDPANRLDRGSRFD